MKRWTPIAIIMVGLLVHEAMSSRILFISPIGSKSHRLFFDGIIHALADNGHHVTAVSPFKPQKDHRNVREIIVEDFDVAQVTPDLFAGGPMAGPLTIAYVSPQLCSDALEKKEVQDLFKEEFELGIISVFVSDCFLSLFHRLKVPYIHVYPAKSLSALNSMMGNPMFPSFVNSPLIHVSHPFSFLERLINTVGEAMTDVVVRYIMVPRIEYECRRRGLCPEDMPSLVEMRENGSLIFINSVRTAESPPRPVVPTIIYCGGIHLQDPKPLPKDLENWVAGAGDEGFIFFSLGSAVVPSSLPEEYRKILVETFGSMKQRVLWKWDQETMEDLPANVRLGKWLPQQDIIGDRRLKLFITHGGALSTQEAIYHGIPVLGLPVFGDQLANMMVVERQGWGRVLRWEELTPKLLTESIISVMTDEKLRAEVQHRSVLVRDVPQDPGHVVNFWVDYVIRHKGASHLRSPVLSMAWYQLYNVDVWLTVFGIVLATIYVTVKCLLAVCRCCCRSRLKSKRE